MPDINTNTDNTNVQPTNAQADQYTETTHDIDTDTPNPMPTAPPGVPPGAPSPNAPNPSASAPQAASAPQKQSQNLAKPPQAASQQPQAQAPVNPAVKQAGWVHDVAQTLAGGPRYKYDINPNTGEMTKTAVPVSTKHLAMAIALQAIGGAATGLAYGKGAGNMGKGAAAAFEQGEERIKQQQELGKKEASDQYARQAQIAQTNMQMLRNEQISAQADSEFQQKDVDSATEEYKDLQDIGAIRQTGITETQAQKMMQDGTLHVTKDMLIPYQVTQARNPDGTPAKTAHGAPKFEKLYALTDPTAEINLPKDYIERAQKAKLQGFVNGAGEPIDLPSDLKMRAHLVAGVRELLRPGDQTNAAIDGLGKGYAHTLHSGTAPQPQGVPQTQNMPALKDSTLEPIADKAADSNDLDQGLFRAVALQESGGNSKVKDSKPNGKGVYAVGPFQVVPSTAAQFTNPATNKPYTEQDIRDPQTNAQVAAQYLSNLVKANNGDIHKALVAYHGAGTDSEGMTGNKYADQVMARIPSQPQAQGQGQGQSQTALQESIDNTPTPEKWESAVDKGMIVPGDLKTLQKLHGAPTLFDGQWSTKDVVGMAEKDKSIDPASVGRLMNWLGPTIDARHEQYEDRQLAIKGSAAVQKTEDIKQADQARQTALDKDASAFLVPPTNFQRNPDIMNIGQDAAKQYLQSHGVQVPDNFADIYNMAKNDSDPTGFTPRVYKGVTGVLGMDRSMARSYINQYLNPDWKEQDYKAKGKFVDSLNPDNPRVGGVIQAAGVASQHLQLAEQLFKNLNNRQSPVWNEAANWLEKDIAGKSDQAVYDAVATQLANEVSKVTTGNSSTTDTSVEHVAQNLHNKMSPEQAQSVFNGLINLMEPRLRGIATSAGKWSANQDYRKTVNPELIKTFASHGIPLAGFGHLFYSPSTGQVWESKTGNKNDAKQLDLDNYGQ